MLLCAELLAVGVLLLSVLELAVVVEPLAVLAYCELACRAVHSYLDVLARLVTCVLDCLADAVESILDAVQSGSEAALVAYRCRESALLKQLGKSVEHLCAHAYSFLLVGSAYGTNHELLERDRSVRVSAAVDDVHHRNGQSVSVAAADVAVQRHVQGLCCSLCSSQRHTEDGVCAELALGGSSVKGEHLMVDTALVEHAVALQCRRDDVVDILNSLQHTLAAVAVLVAVAKLKCFVLAGRRS